MNRKYLVSMAILGLTACATSGPEAPGVNSAPASQDGGPAVVTDQQAGNKSTVAAGSGMQCKKEKLTGSRIPKTVCLTAADREHLQDAAQESMRGIKRTESAVPRKQ